MSSRRHKDRLAGKPPKPSSQHSKLQKQAALAVSVLKVPVSRQQSTRERVGGMASEKTWGVAGRCWSCSCLGRNRVRVGVGLYPEEFPVGGVGYGHNLRSKSQGWVSLF